MRNFPFLVVFGLFLSANGSPQLFPKLREKIQEGLLKRSPCGEGVKPLACKCEDGAEFTPGEGKPACRPREFVSCTCPNGETVEIDPKAALKKLLLSRSPCGDQIKPTSCLCGDDSEIVPDLGNDEGKCPTGWPVSCQCPDGSTHEVAKKIDEKKEKFKEKVLSKSPCGAGVKPSECSCENGDTFTPGQAGSSSLWGYPCKGPPSSCTCPDGTEVEVNMKTVLNIIKTFRDEIWAKED